MSKNKTHQLRFMMLVYVCNIINTHVVVSEPHTYGDRSDRVKLTQLLRLCWNSITQTNKTQNCTDYNGHVIVFIHNHCIANTL